jgi:hypothetical protein
MNYCVVVHGKVRSKSLVAMPLGACSCPILRSVDCVVYEPFSEGGQ